MKPTIFALVAMVCYAISNVILEMKFSKFNNLTLMICYSAVILIFSGIGRQIAKDGSPSFNFPMGGNFRFVIALGIIFAIADYFYVGAYTNGGDLLTVTCITVMFPVFAGIIKLVITKSMPNLWQVAACALAAIAVILVTKGSLVMK